MRRRCRRRWYGRNGGVRYRTADRQNRSSVRLRTRGNRHHATQWRLPCQHPAMRRLPARPASDRGDFRCFANEPELATDAILDRPGDVRVFLQELLRVLAALAEALAAVGEPCAGLFYDALVDADVDEVAPFGDALAVHHVELRLAEGRRDLILDDLHTRAAADDDVAVLDARDAADVDADRRVEFERAAARGGFRIAEHHADLLAQLVDEDQAGLALRDGAGEFSKRLGHQPRLQAHLRFAHLAFDFRFRHERGHRVDDDDVHAVAANKDLDDLERLFAVVGLRDEQVVEVDAQLLRIRRVERVLGIDKSGHAAAALRFGDHLQREGGFARGFRSEDLDDAAAGHAADAERVVNADRASGNGVDGLDGALLAQAHDRSFAELLFDLADGKLHGFHAFAIHPVVAFNECWWHQDLLFPLAAGPTPGRVF